MKYQQHPLSAAFPAMPADDFIGLKDSISTIGVQNPITIFENMVIDGWHRYQAANELGIDCPSVELGDVDPRDFVLAQNKARRHITQAQLVACASAVFKWHPQGGNQTALSAVCSTSKDVAKKTGASIRTVEQYRAVEKKATPEVVDAVKSGAIGLPKAAAIAKLPKEEQAAAISKPIQKAKPTPAPDPIPVAPPEDDGAPDDAEAEALRIQEEAEIKTMQFLLASDEPLADLASKNTQLEAQIKQLELRIAGLQNSNNEYIKTIKRLQNQLKKLQQ